MIVGGQLRTRGRLGEHQNGTGVRQHVREPVRGELRVQGHIHTARVHHAQQGDEPLHAALHRHRDALPRTHPLTDQEVRQPRRPPVQLRVRQRHLVSDHRGQVRSPFQLSAEDPCQRQPLRPLLTRAPLLQQPSGLLGVQRARLGHGPVRGGGQLAQQRAEGVGETVHGAGVEEIGAVLDRPGEPAVGVVPELQRHIEQRGLTRKVGVRRLDARQFGNSGRGVLEDEHDLDERGSARVAFGEYGVHDPVERHQRVVQRLPHALPRTVGELREGQRLVHLRTQHQCVDEEAHEVGEFGTVPARSRRAEHDVAPARPAGEQQLSGGGEWREERGAPRPADGGESPDGLGRHLEQPSRAGRGADGGARPVDGQFQRRHTGQFPLPVGELLLHLRFVQPVALPGGEVGVLDREFGQPGSGEHSIGTTGPHRKSGRVQRAQLPCDHLHRPGVGGNVVRGEHEHVIVRHRAHQQRAQYGAGAEVEGRGHLGAQYLVEPSLVIPARRIPAGRIPTREIPACQISDRQRHRHRLSDDLEHLSVGLGVRGAQRLVPGDERGQRGGERVNAQFPGEPQPCGAVVRRSARLVRVQEPQPLLRGRGHQRPAPVGGGERGRGPRLPAAAALTQPGGVRGVRGDGRVVEERGGRGGESEPPLDLESHPQTGDGVAADGEEVLRHTDPRAAEHVFPDPGEFRFQCGARCRVRDGLGPAHVTGEFRGGGQRPAVDLAVGCQWQPVHGDVGGRHHMDGQPARGVPAQLGCSGAALTAHRHVVGDELVRTGVLHQRDHRLEDRLVPGEHGLDLAQLHAQTTDLDLAVGAADELVLASRKQSDQVAGAVHPGPRGAVRVGDEPFGGQPRTVDVPPGQAVARDAQLAGPAVGHRSQLLVQDHDPGAVDGPADSGRIGEVGGQRPVEGDGDGRLGGSVHIDHPSAGGPAGDQFRRAVLAAGGQRAQVWQLDRRCHRGQYGRRHHGVGDGGVGEQGPERFTDGLGGALGQDQRGARVPGLHQVGDGDVEVGRGELEYPAVLVDGQRRHMGEGEVPESAMGDGDTLGRAAGTRGEQNVRGVVEVRGVQMGVVQVGGVRMRGVRVRGVRVRGDVRRGVGVFRNHPRQALQGQGVGCVVRPRPRPVVADHQLDPGVLDHERQPLGRVVGVERYVGPARLEDGEQRDDQLGAAPQADTHPGLGSHAPGGEPVCEPVGAPFDLGVAEPDGAPLDGGVFGSTRRLALEQPVQGDITGCPTAVREGVAV
ncbi:hypothetical protein CU044_3312 [Streptomyces sp. L-9-10]|nr:hypothetical protein CU044_3312 [Streptomyces sp. L-9-10]